MNSRYKSYNCHITDQGKISVPKHIRDRYHLSPDNDMTFECYEDGIFIRLTDKLDGSHATQITMDEYAAQEMKKIQGNHQKKPIKLVQDKCTLCGCKSGLLMYKGGAFCPTCLERWKEFDDKMDMVAKAAKQIREQNKFIDPRRVHTDNKEVLMSNLKKKRGY